MTMSRARHSIAAASLGLVACAFTTQASAARFAASAVPAPVAEDTARLIGRVDAAQPMHLSVALPLRDVAGLDGLLARLHDPASPDYRRYLTVSAYADRFGPSAADYAAAAAFFRDQGLSVHAQAANRFLIQIDATAADVERVFHVRLQTYRHPTQDRTFMAPDREPTIDAAVPMLEVSGLSDYVRPTPRLVPQAAASATRATGSGPNGQFLGSDMRAAYYGSGALTGAGQSVGLMELEGWNPASVRTYFTKFGPTLTTSLVTVATDSVKTSCTGSCDDGEQALDVEYAIAMAPGLANVYVYVGSAEDVLNRMATDDTAKQLSTSWGWNEQKATDEALFKELAAQGQTLLTASGDYSSLKASGPWPEEDPYLTGVGGTDLTTKGAGGAWSAETGWSGSAGGPSLDKTLLIPSYQKPYITTANAGSNKLHNVPDIAASANTNMYYCANSGCSSAGGTSFASPIWAGFIALANQQAAKSGNGAIGFLNPTLYAHGMDGDVGTLLHDITSGTSGKYHATVSYDLVTGLGSPQPGLISVLAAP